MLTSRSDFAGLPFGAWSFCLAIGALRRLHAGFLMCRPGSGGFLLRDVQRVAIVEEHAVEPFCGPGADTNLVDDAGEHIVAIVAAPFNGRIEQSVTTLLGIRERHHIIALILARREHGDVIEVRLHRAGLLHESRLYGEASCCTRFSGMEASWRPVCCMRAGCTVRSHWIRSSGCVLSLRALSRIEVGPPLVAHS